MRTAGLELTASDQPGRSQLRIQMKGKHAQTFRLILLHKDKHIVSVIVLGRKPGKESGLY